MILTHASTPIGPAVRLAPSEEGDCTGVDPDGCECWNCRHKFILNKEFEPDEDEEDGGAYFERGEHFERVKVKA